MHTFTQFNWFELLEISVFMLLVLLILIFLKRFFAPLSGTGHNAKPYTSTMQVHPWSNAPEMQLLMLALPLELLWEIAQFPLYTVWHEGDWSYILYGLAHCTLGDLLIMLAAFLLVSLLNRSRFWIYSPSLPNIVLFTIFGLIYTIYSEIVNTRIKGTWGYTDLMPIVPVIEVGGMPFLQWLLIPPILIWMMNLMKPTKTA